MWWTGTAWRWNGQLGYLVVLLGGLLLLLDPPLDGFHLAFDLLLGAFLLQPLLLDPLPRLLE